MEIRAKSVEDRELLVAAATGNLEALQDASDHALRQTVCTSGCTALHWAAGSNQLPIVEYLVCERQLPVDLMAVKKSKGRTPLHYACRNGHLRIVQWLIEEAEAAPDMPAKHGVTPFQLAIWQNQFEVARYLVEECGVDPAQCNDFECGAVHWIGLCPRRYANSITQHQDGSDATGTEVDEDENEIDTIDLIPLATWLADQQGVSFHATQRQGHTPLHKAAWGGHLHLIQYLHRTHNLWDDSPDEAGNYAADLADMANTPIHANIAKYLRNHCSRARADSCAILSVPTTATMDEIRKAYLHKARQVHPDRKVANDLDPLTPPPTSPSNILSFDRLHEAYRHLTEEGGRGNQSNPTHSLKLMLDHVGTTSTTMTTTSTSSDEVSLFQARLIAVLLEYGTKGLDLSNVCKKWNQVWPDVPFPDYKQDGGGSTSSLTDFLLARAGDAIEIVRDETTHQPKVYSKFSIFRQQNPPSSS